MNIGLKANIDIAGNGIPDSKLGNASADVLADKDPHFSSVHFCSVIRASAR